MNVLGYYQAAQNLGPEITWPEIRSLYYDDHIDYDQALTLCELSFNTKHRPYGELPITKSQPTKTLLEETGINEDVSIDLSACFYAVLLDLYAYGGLSWFDDISPLLPTSRGSNPDRIRALIQRHSEILIARQ